MSNQVSTTERAKSHRGGRRSTSWKPGQSGNPKGAPRRGISWKEILADYAARETPPEFRQLGSTWREALVAAAFQFAVQGNAGILRTIFDRSDSEPVAEQPDADSDQLRKQIKLELRLGAVEADRKLVEALRGDPERQQRLLTLQAQRLELEAQIQDLLKAGGFNANDSAEH